MTRNEETSDSGAPAPPPAAKAPPRETLHTRIRIEIDRAVRAYKDEHGSSIQAIVEAALIEYLARRNRWPEDDR